METDTSREMAPLKFTTLIPLRDNPDAKLDRNIARLETIFGGVTVEGIVAGRWIDQDRSYHDESYKVAVVCERMHYPKARQEVIRIGRQLGQKAMYFEVQFFDGVEIIPIE